MRAALIAKSHFDNTLPLAKELSKKIQVELLFVVGGERHTESIFDFRLSKLPFGLIEDPKIIRKLIGEKAFNFLENSVQIKFFRFPSWRMRSIQKLHFALRFARYLRSRSFDVIHFNGIVGNFHILYYILVHNSGKIQTIHDSSHHSGEFSLKGHINRYLLTKMNSKLILHSQFAAKELQSKYRIRPERMHIIPFAPFYLYRSEVAEMPSPYEILFLGRISPYKGIEYLLEAFQKVKSVIPEAKLVIAGSGKFYFPIEHLIDDPSIKIDNRYIPTPELAKFIQRAALIVLPYTDATQSGVVMTAFAFHKPVVATDVGGLGEVIQNNITGLLVPPKDSQSLAEAIIKILTNNNLKDRIRKNIQNLTLCEWSWEENANQTLQIYKSFLNG